MAMLEFCNTVLDRLNQVAPIALRSRFDRCELYCDRVLFGLIVDDTLYFKVDNRTRKELAKAGVQLGANDVAVGQSDYAPISTEILEDSLQLTLWLEKAIAAGKRSQRQAKRDRSSWKKHGPLTPEW
jgi:DNA transformation protein